MPTFFMLQTVHRHPDRIVHRTNAVVFTPYGYQIMEATAEDVVPLPRWKGRPELPETEYIAKFVEKVPEISL